MKPHSGFMPVRQTNGVSGPRTPQSRSCGKLSSPPGRYSGAASVSASVARSTYVAKRGIWKETHVIKRFQRWSDCQERTSHLSSAPPA